MKKAKNVLSIITIVFGALAMAAFILLPWLHTLIPAEGVIDDFNKVYPTGQMLLDLLKFFDFSTLSFEFATYNLAAWIRLISLAVMAIMVILFVLWIIFAIVKKRPIQLVWVLVLLIGLAASIAVVLAYTYLGCTAEAGTGAVEIESGIQGFPYSGEALVDGNVALVLPVLNTVLGQGAFIPTSQVVVIIMTVIPVLAALGVILGLIGLICGLAYTARKKDVSEEVSEQVTEIPLDDEEPVEEPVAEPTPVVAEPTPAPVAVEKVEEPVKPEEPVDNSPRLIRRILVHKSGKVIRVLNEHYYDVTTDIFVEPGYAEPHDPNETEQMHYEKILSARGGVAAVKPEPKPVVAPAPVAEPETYERVSFEKRIKSADKSLKAKYNELKSEILSYGVKSRVASGGDTFRLHTKTYVKLTIAGKSIKLYLALNPKDYKGSTIPFADASKKNLYKDIPFVFKVKSDLSLRRAKQLIAETMAKDGLVQEKVEKHDWIKEL